MHYVILSKKKHSWHSCNIIGKNLRSSYAQLETSLVEIDFDSEENDIVGVSSSSYSQLLDDLEMGKRVKISILDSEPLQFLVLNFFMSKSKNPTLIDFYVHVYGDFTYYSGEWINFLDLYSDRINIYFVCASSAQTNLLKKLLDDFANISTLAFSVSEEFLYEKSDKGKELNQIGSQDKIIFMCDRMHVQKNNDLVFDLFLDYISKNKIDNLTLVVAGEVDSFSGLQSKVPIGFLEAKYQKIFQKYEIKYQKKICFIGDVEHAEISRLLKGSDGFISLSLYHDEDFGMAAAEAIVSGLSVCLTAWGGYKDFASIDESIFYAGVSFEEHAYKIEVSEVMRFFQSMNSLIQNNDRTKKSLKNYGKLSIDNSAKELKAFYSSSKKNASLEYQGLRNFHLIKKNQNNLFFNEYLSPTKNSLYNFFYSSYLSGKDDKKDSLYRKIFWINDYIKIKYSLNSKTNLLHSGATIDSSIDFYSIYLESHNQSGLFYIFSDGKIPSHTFLKFNNKHPDVVVALPVTSASKELVNYKNVIYFLPISQTKSISKNKIIVHVVLDNDFKKTKSDLVNFLNSNLRAYQEFILVFTEVFIDMDKNIIESLLFDFINQFSRLGVRFEVLNRSNYFSIKKFTEFSFVEFNSFKYIGLSSIQIHALNSGAFLLKTTKHYNNTKKPFRVQKVSKYLAFEFYYLEDLDNSLITDVVYSHSDERLFLDLKPFH